MTRSWKSCGSTGCAGCVIALLATLSLAAQPVPRYTIWERQFISAAHYDNAYRELRAEAVLQCPDGTVRSIPLFWDGGDVWKLRFSPDVIGDWTYTIRSRDRGLDRETGTFACVASDRRGSIQPMDSAPHHFMYQNGDPVWFMGDTAWALFTDNREEQHHGAAAQKYLQTRAGQGFNVVHAMMLSEAGWGNSSGPPWHDIAAEKINPAYWQEVDARVAFANAQGLVVGLALAWGDKGRQELYPWRNFPNLEARQRYARYVAARYSAYDVYFLVSGEWHAEVTARGSSEADVKQEFIKLGNTLSQEDPHRRMIGIHPMTRHGSVREYNEADWMSFGDYQQNYRELHARILESRSFHKPVVNSEYGYFLRDQNGDGTPDKDNSTSLESMRHASWDIAMAGGYFVTGFGTTYFGGNRDPGPFDLDARKNDDWEAQVGVIKRFFTSLDWWRLEPQDERLTCDIPRGVDGKQLGRLAPPATTYWVLAEPAHVYVVYARGVQKELTVRIGPHASGSYRVERLDPRSGARQTADDTLQLETEFRWTPPDEQDWVLVLTSTDRP